MRNLSDAYVQHELLYRKGTNLVDLLETIEPPFLHPQTAASLRAAAAATAPSSAPNVATSSSDAATPSALESLRSMTHERTHRDLRAFTVVGLARTIAVMCQKIGPDATMNATPLLQAINRFLTRCSVVYSDLEVSNFQWHVASEVVSEICVPLRALLGPDAFATFFPVAQSSSVLQLLLLPVSGIDRTTELESPLARRGGDSNSDAKHRLPTSPLLASHAVDASSSVADAARQAIATCPPELVHFAYRTVRLYGVAAPSFAQLPPSRLCASFHDLNDEVFRAQDSRRKRHAASGSSVGLASPLQRAAFDSAWLRPVPKRLFSSRAANEHADSASGVDGLGRAGGATNTSRNSLLESWALAAEIRHSIKAHSSSVRCVRVDVDEDVMLSGSKSGSCRAWRLASHPCHAQAAIHAPSPILAVESAMDSVHAIALDAGCVHVWDIRTSQVRVKLPFADDAIQGMTLLRTLPFHLHHFAAQQSVASAATPLSFGAGAALGTADFAVATARKVVSVDLRSGPRVVADWRIDARDAPTITTVATVVSRSSHAQAFIAVGTVTGAVVLLDRRTGTHVAKWQALESGRVVMIAQFSPSQVLVVGSDREARVWTLAAAATGAPTALLTITGVPEGVRASQVSVQAFADTNVLYIASGAKVFTARLPFERDATSSSSVLRATRVDAWPLMEPSSMALSLATMSSGSKLSKSKVSAQSMCVLPLRRLLVLGSDDGFLKCVG